MQLMICHVWSWPTGRFRSCFTSANRIEIPIYVGWRFCGIENDEFCLGASLGREFRNYATLGAGGRRVVPEEDVVFLRHKEILLVVFRDSSSRCFVDPPDPRYRPDLIDASLRIYQRPSVSVQCRGQWLSISLFRRCKIEKHFLWYERNT